MSSAFHRQTGRPQNRTLLLSLAALSHQSWLVKQVYSSGFGGIKIGSSQQSAAYGEDKDCCEFSTLVLNLGAWCMVMLHFVWLLEEKSIQSNNRDKAGKKIQIGNQVHWARGMTVSQKWYSSLILKEFPNRHVSLTAYPTPLRGQWEQNPARISLLGENIWRWRASSCSVLSPVSRQLYTQGPAGVSGKGRDFQITMWHQKHSILANIVTTAAHFRISIVW